MLWVLEMEGDVESDLSVFHRVDDMYRMGSRRWAVLVPRLSAYGGAVQYRLRTWDQQETEQQAPASTPAPAVQPGRTPAGGGVEVQIAADGTPMLPGPPSPWDGKEVEATPAALRFSDIGDMFSFG